MFSKGYALWHDGDKNRWDYFGIILAHKYSPTFDRNDTVIMILDLYTKTLSYKINDGQKQVAFKNIATGNGIHYCMGLYMLEEGDSIRLLEWKNRKITTFISVFCVFSYCCDHLFAV